MKKLIHKITISTMSRNLINDELDVSLFGNCSKQLCFSSIIAHVNGMSEIGPVGIHSLVTSWADSARKRTFVARA